MKTTFLEKQILENTKEFAKEYGIHYDKMTESMILNAIREALLKNRNKNN